MSANLGAVAKNWSAMSPQRLRYLQDMKERQKKIDERFARQAAERREKASQNVRAPEQG